MFKKKLTTLLAATLIAALLPTTFLGAAIQEDGGELPVEGWNTETQPIVEVALPGDLIFGINPLYLDADGDGGNDAQIVTSQYQVINYSNVDVLVTASTTAKAGEGVTDIKFLQTNTTDATTGELLSTTAARNVYLVQMLPEKAATISGEAATLNVNEFTLASGAADDIGGYVLGSGAAKVLFRLDACVVTNDAYKLEADNVSGFEFAGAVDPDAAFYEGDVTVTTVFKVETLSENQSTKGYVVSDYNGATYDATVVIATPAN